MWKEAEGREVFPVFFRVARYYLRAEWLRLAAVVFAACLCTFLMVNNTKTMPMSYEAFKAQYGSELTMDRLARKVNIPREQLGDSLEEAYPVIRQQHFTRFLGNSGDFVFLAPVLAGALAALLLCGVFRKRRLAPLLAAGCSRGTIYLVLTVLYFGVFVLVWLIVVPLSLSRYRLPLDAGQQACLRLWKPSLLLSFLFSASVAYFFACLLLRPLPAFLAGAAALYLVQWISGLVPVPVGYLLSLLDWKPSTGPLITQGWITALTAAAAVAGGWLCFRRREQA